MTRIAPLAPVLCSWCDAPATRNLATALDQACTAHFLQWFGPGLPAVEGQDVHPDAAGYGAVHPCCNVAAVDYCQC